VGRFKTRLRTLERDPAIRPQCTCPPSTEHYEQPDGSVFPPFPPCLHPTGVCPEPNGRKQIRTIVIGLVESRHQEFVKQAPELMWWEPHDNMFRIGGEMRVIVWRDERGKLCYYGPPRFWERLLPEVITKGPRVPEDDEQMIAELKRDDDWSQAVLVAAGEP
jgi:hypothetical protein